MPIPNFRLLYRGMIDDENNEMEVEQEEITNAEIRRGYRRLIGDIARSEENLINPEENEEFAVEWHSNNYFFFSFFI